MKVFITKDEEYPIYSLYVNSSEEWWMSLPQECEISEEKVSYIQEIVKKYCDIQEELRILYERFDS